MADQQIPNLAQAAQGILTRASARKSGQGSALKVRTSYSRTNLPREVERRTDVELAALISFRPAGGGVLIRRALTGDERSMFEARAAELDDCLQPAATPAERDRVVLALTDMFSAFSSMRGSDIDGVAKIDSLLRFLAAYPAWAVEVACDAIRRHGVLRNGARDRQWPPSDSELVDEIEREIKLRKTMLAQAVAILEAKVDDIDLRRIRS